MRGGTDAGRTGQGRGEWGRWGGLQGGRALRGWCTDGLQQAVRLDAFFDSHWEGAALVFAAAGCVDGLRAEACGLFCVCWCVLQVTM